VSQLHKGYVITTLFSPCGLEQDHFSSISEEFPDSLAQNALTGTVHNFQMLFAMEQCFIQKPAKQTLRILNPFADQNQARQESIAFDTVTNPRCRSLVSGITARLELAQG
jgi:hypothetical protein